MAVGKDCGSGFTPLGTAWKDAHGPGAERLVQFLCAQVDFWQSGSGREGGDLAGGVGKTQKSQKSQKIQTKHKQKS